MNQPTLQHELMQRYIAARRPLSDFEKAMSAKVYRLAEVLSSYPKPDTFAEHSNPREGWR